MIFDSQYVSRSSILSVTLLKSEAFFRYVTIVYVTWRDLKINNFFAWYLNNFLKDGNKAKSSQLLRKIISVWKIICTLEKFTAKQPFFKKVQFCNVRYVTQLLNYSHCTRHRIHVKLCHFKRLKMLWAPCNKKLLFLNFFIGRRSL